MTCACANNGVRAQIDEVARMCGGSDEQVTAIIEELCASGTCADKITPRDMIVAQLCAACIHGASGDCVAQQSLLAGSLPDEITHDRYGVLGCRLREVAS
jgi:hypothetical protein